MLRCTKSGWISTCSGARSKTMRRSWIDNRRYRDNEQNQAGYAHMLQQREGNEETKIWREAASCYDACTKSGRICTCASAKERQWRNQKLMAEETWCTKSGRICTCSGARRKTMRRSWLITGGTIMNQNQAGCAYVCSKKEDNAKNWWQEASRNDAQS